MRRTLVGLVAALTLAVGAVGGVTAGAHHDPLAVVAADHAAASATPAAADITVTTWRPDPLDGDADHQGVRT